MTLPKNKLVFKFTFDHIIDIITNSSSELFVIENKCAKEMIVEMVNEALKGCTSISINSIEERFFNDSETPGTHEWKINDTLENFPEEAREEIKQKYFTKPKYYGVVFDRDWVYNQNNEGFDVRDKLFKLGFTLEDTDY